MDKKDAMYEKQAVYCNCGCMQPTTFVLWGKNEDKKWERVNEYCYDPKQEGRLRTDEEQYQALERFCGDRVIDEVVCTSATPSIVKSFVACIQRHGRFEVSTDVESFWKEISENQSKSIRINDLEIDLKDIMANEGNSLVITNGKKFAEVSYDNEFNSIDILYDNKDGESDEFSYNLDEIDEKHKLVKKLEEYIKDFSKSGTKVHAFYRDANFRDKEINIPEPKASKSMGKIIANLFGWEIDLDQIIKDGNSLVITNGEKAIRVSYDEDLNMLNLAFDPKSGESDERSYCLDEKDKFIKQLEEYYIKNFQEEQ